MKKVLLVEDDFYIRGLYKMAFEKKGYVVVDVESGNEALEKIQGDKFSLVILDLMLPGISGIEVLKKVKQSQEVSVYILTNVSDTQMLKEAVQLGAKAYFLKVDYTPKQLIAAIEEKETAGSSA